MRNNILQQETTSLKYIMKSIVFGALVALMSLDVPCHLKLIPDAAIVFGNDEISIL
jgi:hypothetical protein